MSMHSWIRNLFARPTRPIRKAAPRARLALESLEDRVVPALSVTNNTIGSTLVSAILGPGVSFSNVSLTARTATGTTKTAISSSAGTFSGGTGVVGFESGIILSTGGVQKVVGPNQFDGTATILSGIEQLNGMAGDTQLTALAGTGTFDATILEFDFVPNFDTLSFRYVFASEEYNEYANSEYSDVFGFYVNGVNKALIPGTTTPVSINTVNGGNPLGTSPQNAQFYRNNDLQEGGGSIAIEMDGLTTVLTLVSPVNRNVTNHMKLAIADVGDARFDSNVFIEAGSFTKLDPPTVTRNSAAVTSPEGTPATNSGTFSDPQGNGTVALTATVGTITKNIAAGTWSWSAPAPEGPAAPTIVTITATDSANLTATTTFTYAVTNVAPTATLQTSSGITYGVAATAMLVNPSDPSASDTTGGFHYAFSLDSNTIGTATYATSGTSNTVNFGVINAGNHTVFARIFDNDGGSTPYSLPLVVAKANAVVSVSGYSGTYDAAAHGATGSATGVGGVNLSSSLSLGANFTNAPGGTAHWVFNGGTNYNNRSGDIAINIAKAQPVISFSPAGGTYNGSAFSQPVLIGGVGHAAGASLEGVAPVLDYVDNGTGEHLGNAAPTDAGSYSVIASFAGSTNFTAHSVSGQPWTIDKASSTTTVTAPGGVYNGMAFVATASVTGAGTLIDEGLVTFSYHDVDADEDLGDVAPVNAGNYTVTATYLGDANHDGSSETVSFVIAKATSATTTLGDGPFTYDGTVHTGGSATVTGDGVFEGDVTLSYSGDQVNAGVYHVTAHYSGDRNHLASDGESVAITILKADATILVNGYSTSYDGAAHTATGSATGVGGVDLSALLDLSSTTHINAGSYADAWYFAGNANYNATSGTVTDRITAASLDTFSSAVTQAALNVNKEGNVTFALSIDGGVVDGQTVAQLFDGATFTLKMRTSATASTYEAITITSTATVSGGVVHVALRLQNDTAAYNFFLQGVNAGEPSASRADWECITLSALSKDANYSISEDVLTRIFLAGK